MHPATLDSAVRLPWPPTLKRRHGERTFLQSSGGSATDPARVAEAWVTYLKSFRWAHVATLTSESARSRPELVRLFKDGFVRQLAYQAQRGIAWFYAVEYDAATRCVPHIHALLGHTEMLTVKQIERSWPGGHTRIVRYDPTQEGAAYVTKDLLLDPDGYDWSKRLPSRLALVDRPASSEEM